MFFPLFFLFSLFLFPSSSNHRRLLSLFSFPIFFYFFFPARTTFAQLQDGSKEEETQYFISNIGRIVGFFLFFLRDRLLSRSQLVSQSVFWSS
ncbi:hypothetical protein F5Y11DRAFT_62725 [Daldinia sp. FL1419]|nr:hypothetical protein F5Y11DRAFT_62725 [Daldinia sp. FL1419]